MLGESSNKNISFYFWQKLISRCTWKPFLLHLMCGGLLKGALPFPAVAEAEASSDPKEAPWNKYKIIIVTLFMLLKFDKLGEN